MNYEIEIHKNALKFLMVLDRTHRERIIKRIKELSKNPFPKESIRIKGREEKLYRLRAGSYRILYYVDEDLLTVFISALSFIQPFMERGAGGH